MQTIIAAAVLGSPHGTSATAVCGVDKAAMQGDSQVAMLWNLRNLKPMR